MITGAPRARPFFLLLVVCTFCTRKRYVHDGYGEAETNEHNGQDTTQREARRSKAKQYEAVTKHRPRPEQQHNNRKRRKKKRKTKEENAGGGGRAYK